EHFVVKNFRCFSGLHLKQLGRINLIAGKNNTGKTALLESIHLHNNPADVQLPVEINKARGIQQPGKAVEDVVSWLFYGKHTLGGLDASTCDEKGVTRTLSMWLLDASTSRERFPEQENALRQGCRADFVDANLPRPMLEYEQTNQRGLYSIGVFTGVGVSWLSARIPWRIPSIYLNSGLPASEQDMKHFGELAAAKRQDEILAALRILEPRLKGLALVPLSGETAIHGDIGLPRMLPMSFMGEGVRRLLSILLAIANAPGGVVLIDEVENGLHYSVLKDVWKAIGQAAR